LNIIQSLSITQKDDLKTMLALGIRYFEFRPALLHNQIRPLLNDNELYFTHLVIPGMRYAEFLDDCVEFLLQNPGEIIVCQVRWDGITTGCDHPDDLITEYHSRAIEKAQGNLKFGGLNDMSRTIDQLRQDNMRLILFQMAKQYNIYSDSANATVTGMEIVRNYENISAEEQQLHDFTVVQCQATATNMPVAPMVSMLPSSTGMNSLLLSTKAVADSLTLPWIAANVAQRLKPNKSVILMDDFVDGALVDVARTLSFRRLHA
jgi:hypothetical protein